MTGPGAHVFTYNTITLFCLRKRNARNPWIQWCIFKEKLYDKFKIRYIPTEENPADICQAELFSKLYNNIGHKIILLNITRIALLRAIGHSPYKLYPVIGRHFL